VNALRAIHGEYFNDFMEGSRFGEHTNFFENYIVLNPGANISRVDTVLNKLADQMVRSDSFAVATGGN
jgi:hypothetical protein